jgi:hypothetical protein
MKIYKNNIEIEAIQLTEENREEILNLIPKEFIPIITRVNIEATEEENGLTCMLYLKFKKNNHIYIAREGDYVAKINKEIFAISKDLFESIFVNKDNYLKEELKCKGCGKVFKTLKDIQCSDTKITYYDLKFENKQIILEKKNTIECDFKFSCPICGTYLEIKNSDLIKLLK